MMSIDANWYSSAQPLIEVCRDCATLRAWLEKYLTDTASTGQRLMGVAAEWVSGIAKGSEVPIVQLIQLACTFRDGTVQALLIQVRADPQLSNALNVIFQQKFFPIVGIDVHEVTPAYYTRSTTLTPVFFYHLLGFFSLFLLDLGPIFY
jgi:hypothetical protein